MPLQVITAARRWNSIELGPIEGCNAESAAGG